MAKHVFLLTAYVPHVNAANSVNKSAPPPYYLARNASALPQGMCNNILL